MAGFMKLASIGLSLSLTALQLLPAMAEPSEAERNLNEFKTLSMERQRAILFVESLDEAFGPMSLFECAVEVPRATMEIHQRMKEGLNVGASSTRATSTTRSGISALTRRHIAR